MDNFDRIINRITEDRMRRVKMFPSDTMMIELQIRLAVASAIYEAHQEFVRILEQGDK